LTSLRRLSPPDAAPWLRDLDGAYEIYGAPSALVPSILDEGLAAAFREMRNTEVEIMPHLVNVQLREVVLEAEPVRPLLDFAVRLVTRLEQRHDQLAAFTPEDAKRRGAEVDAFLASFHSGA
jgi:hypothetical protein